MEDKIKTLINQVLQKLDIGESSFVVEHPEDFKNGDYSTNVAMACAKALKTNPKELAEKIVDTLRQAQGEFPEIQEIQVAGAGFINFYLSREFFTESVKEIVGNKNFGSNEMLAGQKIMVEYTDPNPFKPFHIGHLMTNAIGESIARVYEYSGATVKRANYQGDVGLHIAKAFYGMQKKGMPENMDAKVSELARYIGDSYVLGNTAYEEDEEAKKEIDILNKKIYSREDAEVNKVYDWGFKVTMEAFEELYKILGTKFDHYFLESKMAPVGERVVRDNIGKVFEESDGAIVFKAEAHDPKLHTRVFITKAGLPTYETKELGLTEEKFRIEPDMNMSVVVTANEQADYMRVVAKAISIINPEYSAKMRHITHGMMRLSTGKMGSRKGNVITGESLIRDTIAIIGEKLADRQLDEDSKNKISEVVGVAAIKYSILRSKIGSDIVYDVEESISTEGDSGPYLQYAYARANSILEKAKTENVNPDFASVPSDVTEVEKMLYRFPEVVVRAGQEAEPHHIATYLVLLARAFNSFYANSIIVGKDDAESGYKVALTGAFATVMKNGLSLLGIESPLKM